MRLLKYIIISLLVLIAIVFGLIKIADEPRPEGITGPSADDLARKMLLAVNDSAWQNTGAVTWQFIRSGAINKYIWDKKRHLVQAEFAENVVQIDINNRKGLILGNRKDLSTLDRVDLCEKAWKLWINDSFWLNPVTKAFDPGTSRSIVNIEDNTQGLMVSYSSGGVTPGDAYLWLLDDSYRPKAWKFWVSIIPVGGMRFSWDNWIQLSTGAWVSTSHDGLIEIRITEARGKEKLEELTGQSDLFHPLIEGTDLIDY